MHIEACDNELFNFKILQNEYKNIISMIQNLLL